MVFPTPPLPDMAIFTWAPFGLGFCLFDRQFFFFDVYLHYATFSEFFGLS